MAPDGHDYLLTQIRHLQYILDNISITGSDILGHDMNFLLKMLSKGLIVLQTRCYFPFLAISKQLIQNQLQTSD